MESTNLDIDNIGVGALVGAIIQNNSSIFRISNSTFGTIGNVDRSSSNVGGFFGSNIGGSIFIDSLSMISVGNVTAVGDNTGGLIGVIDGGSLTVDGISITNAGAGGIGTVRGNVGTGGLIGLNNNGTFTMSGTNTIDKIISVEGDSQTGGVYGGNTGGSINISGLTMTSIGNITGTANRVAGIGGSNSGAGAHNISITIGSIGDIVGTNAVGGLLGFTNANLASFSTIAIDTIGTITSTADNSDAAGMVGRLAGDVSVANYTGKTIGQITAGNNGNAGLFFGLSEPFRTITVNGFSLEDSGNGGITGIAAPGGSSGGFAGGNTGIINATNVAIDSLGTLTGDTIGGFIGSNTRTATFTDLTIRSVVAAGAPLFNGFTNTTMTLNGRIQIFGANVGSFDSDNVTWGDNAIGVISGQLAEGNLPDALVDTVPDNVFLRFFDPSGDTFYQVGGTANPDLSEQQTITSDGDTMILFSQEAALLPPEVIQFLPEGEDAYQTYGYPIENDEDTDNFYIYDTEFTELYVPEVPDPEPEPKSEPEFEPAENTTEVIPSDIDDSSVIEKIDDLGDETEGESDVDDSLDIEDELDGENVEEEQEAGQKSSKNQQTRQATNIAGLLESKDGDDTPDIAERITGIET